MPRFYMHVGVYLNRAYHDLVGVFADRLLHVSGWQRIYNSGPRGILHVFSTCL